MSTVAIDEELVARAIAARGRAYAPYSKYKVGAALRLRSGEIVEGCNVENATYGLTVCAERSAVVSAVSNGHQVFQAIAVATEDGGMPCGLCRQTLFEFSEDLPVFVADSAGRVRVMQLAALIPHGFGPPHRRASSVE